MSDEPFRWPDDDELAAMLASWTDSENLSEGLDLLVRGIAECDANGWTDDDRAALTRISEILEPLLRQLDDDDD